MLQSGKPWKPLLGVHFVSGTGSKLLSQAAAEGQPKECLFTCPCCICHLRLALETLSSDMLGVPVDCSTHLGPTLAALSNNASKPQWLSLEDIDVPLCQRCLSDAIDEAVQAQLLSIAPSTHSRALAQSTSLPHAGDWLNGFLHHPSDYIFMTESSIAASDIGCVSLSTALLTRALSVVELLISLETTKLAAEGTQTE